MSRARGFLENLLGQQTGGILGTQFPAQPPVRGAPVPVPRPTERGTPAPSQASRLLQNPAFLSALNSFGQTLAAPGTVPGQAINTGQRLTQGLGAFNQQFAQQQAAQRAAQQQQVQEQLANQLTASKIQEAGVARGLREREVELRERGVDIDLRDLERKERSAQLQEGLLNNLLGSAPTNQDITNIGTEATLTQGEESSIETLKAQRQRLLAGLAVPGVSDIAQAKIDAIDDEVKFQRDLAKETRKQQERLTPQQAATASLVRVGQTQLDKAEKLLKSNGKFDESTIAAMQFRIPFTGEAAGGVPGTKGRNARSLMLSAINAQLRAESGAAVPEEEVDRAFARFVPSILDNDQTKQQKLDSLRELLSTTESLSKGPVAPSAPSAPQAVTTQAQFDALPSGALFIENGQTFRKP